MATIKIHRTDELVNRGRGIAIFIDGHKIGIIGNGQTNEVEVAPGQHSIVAKIDWCSSQELLFDSSSPKLFLVGGFKYGRWLMPFGIIIMALHFVLKYAFGFDYLILLYIPTALFLIYYLTLGRKKYLSLTERKIN